MSNYDFFQNKQCEYFPCHETDDEEGFSCLFCYCPLYAPGLFSSLFCSYLKSLQPGDLLFQQAGRGLSL